MITEEVGDVCGSKLDVFKTEDRLGCPLLVGFGFCVCRWWASDKVVCNGVPMVCC